MAEDRDFHPRSPHFDGDNENIVSDPGGGPQMGIRMDQNPEFPGKRNLFGSIAVQTPDGMEQFERMFGNDDKVKQD
ncbi:hypothetical protein [Pseudalkalibacillus caeni]|uniref:Uncharacterized protein n=1 Tax=Exobacillus caeni TaxID=2574798 RepID=A0A5R9F8X8_9BACL|nr:hypothetical protein [Pseudalkalibacillus caeni]TLS38969.1 hypothetical protein FCL54_01260 [Pseudalkalibacillus caeni]